MDNKITIEIEDSDTNEMLDPYKNNDFRMKKKFDPNMYMLGDREICPNPFYGYMLNPNIDEYSREKSKSNSKSNSKPNPTSNSKSNLKSNPTSKSNPNQYMMYPKSNVPIKKTDFEEKNKFRIYPHMFRQPQQETIEYGTTYGGVDYPIPKRFELGFLQDRSQIGDVDYDMILTNNQNDGEMREGSFNPVIEDTRIDILKKKITQSQQPRDLDHYYDKNPTDKINQEKINQQKINQEKINQQMIEIPRIGVPFSQLITIPLKCNSNEKQSNNTLSNNTSTNNISSNDTSTNEDWKKRKMRDNEDKIECNEIVQSQTLMPMSDAEKAIFGSEVDRTRPKYQTYPSLQAQKTGFFELGPAIPPPNPMLLSNVPSGVLVPPLKPTEIIETFETLENEYSTRTSSLRGDLEKKIIKIVEQKFEIWKQMSEVRNQMDTLKQRELDAKKQSDMIDVSNSIFNYGAATRTLNKLRRLEDYLEKQEKQLSERLMGQMQNQEYLQFQKQIQNRTNHYQTLVKQYNELPADDQIFAFQSINFEGDAFKMKTGFYNYPDVGGIKNQKLKSLKIGKDVTVILYNKPNRQGRVLVYHGPKRVHTLPILWETGVNGIEVIRKPTDQIQIFDAPFYQGSSYRLPVGFYDYPRLGGIGQGRLNSIVIPPGIRVRLFSRPNKQGETIDFVGPQKMSFLPSGWSKKVFGILIE